METLKARKLWLIGFTLFSMFFGAGNLIFPPFLGAQAGTATWPAMLGFLLSAVGFPILGVIAVARAGGLPALAGRVHPTFAAVFTVLIYLSIGPCLAIPRTASTSFEMAVTPFIGSIPPTLWQFLYSVLFFAVALALALRPEKLSDRLGKLLCPCLILLIVVVFIGCVVRPVGMYGAVSAPYDNSPVIQGFLGGYQTMDTIAALNFGIIIALNIRALGVKEERAVVHVTVRAGWIAGGLMIAIYAMLAHIGALSGGAYPGGENGAQTLTRLVNGLFGPIGNVILAAIFVIACFNTCVGLISCCSEYFHLIVPRYSYKAWACFFAVASMLVSNAGLTQILKISVPILNAIYPVAIVLIVLSFFQKWLEARKAVYGMTVLFTGFASVLYALYEALPMLPLGVLKGLPLAGVGLGWVPFALAGLVLGLIRPRKN